MQISDTIVCRRVLAEPTTKSKTDRLRSKLAKMRTHKRRWPIPTNATAIINMHWTVETPDNKRFYAALELEIPTPEGADFYKSVVTGASYEAALTALIQKMEREDWLFKLRDLGVCFRITGAMEDVYRGWL